MHNTYENDQAKITKVIISRNWKKLKFQLFDIAGAEIYTINQHIVSLAKVKYVRNKVRIIPGNFNSTIQE